ncbi:MAG: FAD-dependent oxidoreductase [Elusimicrobia bacterium]|nr:FAD-dependent oxidoreductase [Elusimicrobiota bacterium]
MSYDAIVIGGGITGAGVLRDLALRGYKCLLIEKGKPGHATTAASSHLIHGGLRYLLYDRLTTQTTCWDSGHIVRIARPLLTRLPILWPVYRGHRHGLETVETLLESYDPLQRMKGGRPHLRFSPEEALRLVPGLKSEGLRGAVVFDEWWVDPVALVEANLASARRAGADMRTETKVVGLRRARGSVQGVDVSSTDGKREEVAAPIVINAAGPWVESVADLAGTRVPLRLQKGTHLVYEKDIPSLKSPAPVLGFILEAEDRSRYVFVIPARGTTLVGPTDVATLDNPDHLSSSEEEKRYLLASVRRYFADFPESYDRAVVGARPILGQEGSEKRLSREFEIYDHSSRDGLGGFITVAGGKMSDFRLMGQETGDLVGRLLRKEAPCRTHLLTLKGEPVPEVSSRPVPSKSLKRFLRRHPRLRELHALGHLAVDFGKHLFHPPREEIRRGTVEKFRQYYQD